MSAKILVVDDEPDVGTQLANALILEGYEAKSVTDPAAALKLAKHQPFDLLVVDYMIPSISGIQLLNQIRESIPTIRSIVISGKLEPHASEDEILEDIRGTIAADAYIHKPVSSARLLETVKNVLSSADGASWTEIAQQHVGAKKTTASIKEAERAMRRHRVTRQPKPR